LADIRSLKLALSVSAFLVVVAAFTLVSGGDRAFGASVAQCQETQLDVHWVSGEAGLSHASQIIVITNISASACKLSGYPTVKMTGGASVVTSVAKKTRNGYLGGLGGPNAYVPLPVVKLRAHGGTASSMVEGGDVPIGNAVGCVIFNKVSIEIANLKPSYRFGTRFSGCVRPQVHPIVKGSTGSSLK
jgi:hypothetical protein